MKTQQQRSLISSRSTAELKDRRGRNELHLVDTNEKVINSECFIRGENDNIKTEGPGGTQLVRYFSCKKFAEMTPAQRFTGLRRKGLFMQCLYPGAKGDYGKHKEGKCQKDFVCTHIDHQKYPQKKYVLICDEHKMDEANKDVLQKYKLKWILRNKRIDDLPTYAKEIKLAYLGTTDKNSSHLPMNSVSNDEERSIYQLQTITIENQNFIIFYNSGCGDFVSKWSAIQKLGTRAHLEHSGPIKVGGVRGLSAENHRLESTLSIYHCTTDVMLFYLGYV